MSDRERSFSELLGLTLEEAYAVLAVEGLRLRVTSQDGVFGVITADFRFDRVNVGVERGKISHVSGLG